MGSEKVQKSYRGLQGFSKAQTRGERETHKKNKPEIQVYGMRKGTPAACLQGEEVRAYGVMS